MRCPQTRPELELIRLLAAVEEVRAARRSELAELADRVDDEALVDALRHQRMLPLVGRRLAEVRDLRPVESRAAAEAIAAQRALGAAQQMVTERALGALEAAGVRALPLKGPYLSQWLYGDPGLRLSADIDVLVAPRDMVAATDVLRALGYTPHDESRAPLLHATLVHSSLPAIELHHRVHWYERAFSLALLERSEPTADGIRRPTPADELATLLLFYARDGLAGLRLAADVAACWDARAASIAPGAIGALAAEHPSLARPLAAAAAAADRLVGLPARTLLGQQPVPERALRLADWTLSESTTQSRANTHLMDLMLTRRGGRTAALRRTILSPGQGAGHAPRLLRRFALAGWRRRGGRTPVPPLPGAVA